MSEGIKLIPYREMKKKKSLEYYYANKEVVAEKSKNRYSMLTPEQKKKRHEYNKRWYDKLCPERKEEEIRQKRRQYNNNRDHNTMLTIRE